MPSPQEGKGTAEWAVYRRYGETADSAVLFSGHKFLNEYIFLSLDKTSQNRDNVTIGESQFSAKSSDLTMENSHRKGRRRRKKMQFTIPGKPKGKTRPRFARGGKNTYTDRGTAEYEKKVAESYLEAGGKLEAYSGIRIKAYYLIPQKTRKDIVEAMLSGQLKPTKKPDLDNVLKIIMDGLTGVAFEDDNQICQVYMEKVYGEEPRVEVELY